MSWDPAPYQEPDYNHRNLPWWEVALRAVAILALLVGVVWFVNVLNGPVPAADLDEQRPHCPGARPGGTPC